jgi:hypothetical protein
MCNDASMILFLVTIPLWGILLVLGLCTHTLLSLRGELAKRHVEDVQRWNDQRANMS